jgi:hypothetical protein
MNVHKKQATFFSDWWIFGNIFKTFILCVTPKYDRRVAEKKCSISHYVCRVIM